eukprot:847949-Pelagomonas_calceolata.AAC.2
MCWNIATRYAKVLFEWVYEMCAYRCQVHQESNQFKLSASVGTIWISVSGTKKEKILEPRRLRAWRKVSLVSLLVRGKDCKGYKGLAYSPRIWLIGCW